MTDRDYAPLSSACVRGLCDKLYEKRKFAGVEIEKMVKDFNDAKNTSQIKRLIRVLGQDLMSSTNTNVKNGALMGLSSVAVGLGKVSFGSIGKGSVDHMGELIHPIVACLGESEARVRYAATEALFNVLKIVRSASLAHFPLVFDALARLAADPELQVRQGAELLDKLVKDIVTESGLVEVALVVPLVRERLYARSAAARQFGVAWLSALDAAPALGLRAHLPLLLDPLLTALDDPNPEIRRMCDVQLNEFLRSIKKDPSEVDFESMINILITHAQSTEELLQLTALTWLKEFVSVCGRRALPYASGALAAALPRLAPPDHSDMRTKIRETAAAVNHQLIKLVVSAADPTVRLETPRSGTARGDGAVEGEGEGERSREGEACLDLEAVVGVLTQMLHHSSVHTKVAALDWILHLYNKLPDEMYLQTERVFVSVVGSLADPADDVVRRALAVLAEICSCPSTTSTAAATTTTTTTATTTATTTEGPESCGRAADTGATPLMDGLGDLESSPYYHKFLKALLRLLAADENLLEDRGSFIIRQLCVLVGAEAVYRGVALALRGERELRFAARLVDVLSTLLLSAAELHHLRRSLRAFGDQATVSLFETLYECWSHSPVALLALCLLTHNYGHCTTLISTFGDLEITVDFLTEVDKLVQLIESPVFAYLRLELLEDERSRPLRAALFGLLMLLPQSEAFHALRRRLHCAPAPPPACAPPAPACAPPAPACAPPAPACAPPAPACAPPAPAPASAPSPAAAPDFEVLLGTFRRVQAAHRDYRTLERRLSRARLFERPHS